MKLRKLLLAAAFAGLASGTAQAVPYVGQFQSGVGYDGLLNGVTGFDIYSNGSAAFFCWTVGGCNVGTPTGGVSVAFGTQLNPLLQQVAAGDTVRTLYQGVANVVNPGVPTSNLIYPGSTITGPGGWQITVAADFFETIVLSTGAPVPTLQALVNDGGRVGLFYDNNNLGTTVVPCRSGTFIATAADVLPGVGYTDGCLIAVGAMSGAMSSPTTLTQFPAGTVSGSSNISGLISSGMLGNAISGAVGFIPIPGDYNATTTLQYGGTTSGLGQTVGFFDTANGFTRMLVNQALVMQADANLILSAAVPEPATLALLGIALAGLGFGQRRRAA